MRRRKIRPAPPRLRPRASDDERQLPPDPQTLFSAGFPGDAVARSLVLWLTEVVAVCRPLPDGQLPGPEVLGIALRTLSLRHADDAETLVALVALVDAAYALAARADVSVLALHAIVKDALLRPAALDATRRAAPRQAVSPLLSHRGIGPLVHLLVEPLMCSAGVAVHVLELLAALPPPSVRYSLYSPTIVMSPGWVDFAPMDDAERRTYSGVVCRILREMDEARPLGPVDFERHALPLLLETLWPVARPPAPPDPVASLAELEAWVLADPA
jgi:hypothetical protein